MRCVHICYFTKYFTFLFPDHSDDQFLIQNNVDGRAEEPGGECGEKDQRDVRASDGEETAGLCGRHEYAKGSCSKPSTISYTAYSQAFD